MTVQLRAGGSTARAAAPASPRVLDASAKLERSALAGVLRHPSSCGPCWRSCRWTTSTTSCTARFEAISSTAPLSTQTGVGLLAELDAYADAEGIGEATGTELLLRLRERELQRELRAAPVERRSELTEALARLRERAASISA